MFVAGVAGWTLFGLLLLVYISFGRHMGPRVEALSEYVEFLLQNRAAYEDHRRTYAQVLQDATAASPGLGRRELAFIAKQALDGIAESMPVEVVLTNALGRGMPAQWLERASMKDVMDSATKAASKSGDGRHV